MSSITGFKKEISILKNMPQVTVAVYHVPEAF